jgi:hypothetical protein
MATHEFRCWPDPFEAVANGHKRFEWRRDDREPRVEAGDYLHLREWEPPPPSVPLHLGLYTGRSISTRVTYTLRGPAFGMPEGYVVMSLGEVTVYPKGDPL